MKWGILLKQDAVKPLLFIAIPTRGKHSFHFSQDISGTIYPSNFSLVQMYIGYREVGFARNIACAKAIELGAKYLVFRDEDVIGTPIVLKTLLYHMSNHPDWTFCSALYATKSYPPEPLLYTEWGQGANYDWQLGDLKRVLFTGMGYSIIRVSDLALLEPDEYEDSDYNTGAPVRYKEFFKTGDGGDTDGKNTFKYGHTEDAHFFKLLEQKGLKSYIDTSLLCQHYDDKSDIMFQVPVKGKPDAWNPPEGMPLTLNIGAGGTYNPYEVSVDLIDAPHITVQADIRSLPQQWTETFDLVHAEHVLEHFDYGQTKEILAEWTRVVKPGGRLVITVPDLEEYAKDILGVTNKDDPIQQNRHYDGIPGYIDTMILGGIYGDQGHPFWRQEAYGGTHEGRFLKHSFEHNHHKAGFTLRSLGGYMKSVGLVLDRTTRQDYQLMIEAHKPLPEVNDGQTELLQDESAQRSGSSQETP